MIDLQLAKLRQIEWPFWIGFIFFIAVIVSCFRLWFSSVDWLKTRDSLPVEQLIVEGNQDYVEYRDVLEALAPQMQQSFFELDVNQAQQNVENIDWVYWVAIRKEWPNMLKVNLIEQEAEVHWNGDFLLNTLGQVFQADVSRLLKAIPALFGPEGDETKALQAYRDLSQLLALENLAIDEMTLTERHAIRMILSNGIKLNLGREDWLVRIKRFIEFYPDLNEQNNVEYVDLRYDTGFSVGHKSDQTQTK